MIVTEEKLAVWRERFCVDPTQPSGLAWRQLVAGVFVDYGEKLGAAFRAAALYLPNDCQQLLAIAAELETYY